MAEQSGQDTEVERTGEAEGEQESVQPAKRAIWTPERLAKAAATRAETKRKKEEKEARKAAKQSRKNTEEVMPSESADQSVSGPKQPIRAVTGEHRAVTSANGFDWDKAPLAEAINHLADMKREYDRVAQIVMRRQSTNKPSWVCWSQLHKDIVPVSVQKLCRKTGEDGKWAFRDDGVFKTENGIRMPDPVFCCNTYCFEVFQKSKPLMSLSRH